MSQHIPPALLAKFIAGDLEEPVAMAVAGTVGAWVASSGEWQITNYVL